MIIAEVVLDQKYKRFCYCSLKLPRELCRRGKVSRWLNGESWLKITEEDIHEESFMSVEELCNPLREMVLYDQDNNSDVVALDGKGKKWQQILEEEKEATWKEKELESYADQLRQRREKRFRRHKLSSGGDVRIRDAERDKETVKYRKAWREKQRLKCLVL